MQAQKSDEIQINQKHFELLVFKEVGNNRSKSPLERILGCVYELFISVRDKKKKSYLLAYFEIDKN